MPIVRRHNLSGQKFNHLRIIKFSHTDSRRQSYWLCLCDCGNKHIVRSDGLKNGGTKSCGCLFIKVHTIHGMTKTPEYGSWNRMRHRCYFTTDKSYKDYGGRGITVCERWKTNFKNFFDDMGLRPSPKHTIDRINNNGNYEPTNCKWSTRSEQMRNKRIQKKSKSGISGVYWRGNSKKWRSHIFVNKKVIHLGTFSKLEDAKHARLLAEEKYWS